MKLGLDETRQPQPRLFSLFKMLARGSCARGCRTSLATARAATTFLQARAGQAVPRRISAKAALADSGDQSFQDGPEDYSQVAARLNLLLERPRMTGRDIREMVFEKWGRTYDVILRKQGNRVHLQVMWRFLEQQSFPLTEAEYMEQLNAVAEYITEWGAVDMVRRGIRAANSKGPGYTGGGNAKCISIPLDVNLNARKGEWS